MADLLAAGARIVAWILDHPVIASAALNGAAVDELVTMLGKNGWGQRR